MNRKITWEEIKKQYPNQWVSLDDVECDNNGEIKSAVVIAAGSDLKSVTQFSKGLFSSHHQFEYTGIIENFLGFAQWKIENAPVN